MDILIIANFCRDFSETDNGRFMYLAKELSKEHYVEIVTSSFNHSKKKQKDPLTVKWPFKITFLKEPGYKKNISFRRFYSHFMWGREVEKYLASRKKPDVVYCAVPSLTAPRNAAKYCEKNRIRFIIDIQDLWPEAFKMAFNVPVISDLVFYPFSKYADSIYKRADQVIAVSQTYVDRAMSVNPKCKEGIVVYLGTDLKTFEDNCRKYPVVKKDDRLWLGYCGSMGDSYDLNCVIDALALLEEPPVFIAIGDGEKRAEFEKRAKDKNDDCIFTGYLPYEKMCGWLKACDMLVNPIVGNSAASIINKHGDYACAGKPVLNTQESLEYRNLIHDYQMGLNCNNGDSYDLALKIQELITNLNMRIEMSSNARNCASEKFDRENSYKSITNCILKQEGLN